MSIHDKLLFISYVQCLDSQTKVMKRQRFVRFKYWAYRPILGVQVGTKKIYFIFILIL